MSAASVLPALDMSALLKTPEVASQAPESPLESVLSTVTPEDASADTIAEVKFQFRSLLSDSQRADLKAGAPAAAAQMVKDYNALINFGEPVLARLNASSIAILNEQKDIKIPEADQIVNNLLREMDGYEAKYKNAQLEDMVSKLKNFFKGTKYSIKSMVRDAKPIVDRMEDAEITIRKMELSLGDNTSRARRLHKQTLSTMEEVVAVLASLEEIAEVIRADYDELDAVIRSIEASGAQAGEYRGETKALVDLRELHADIAQGLTEVEKSWFDWRQQFFLGYASAPSLRNLILVSASMQRRLQVFRTQGIPSARRGLAMWQQAALAKEGGKMGDSLAKGTNQLTQAAFGAAADAVDAVAMASQAPILSEETVFKVIESVKAQANSLVAADKWGREMRARNLAALESGEKAIESSVTDSRRQMVANAISTSSRAELESGPAMPQGDILASLGVKS
jgi:uncharacterized protein YaaN involved in tellurite resistance